MAYTFISDNGHGWLSVKVKELVELGVADKVSPYSYVNGRSAYLEEDCDLGLFYEAYVAKHGKPPVIVSGKHYDRWSGRNYRSYNANNVEWCSGIDVVGTTIEV